MLDEDFSNDAEKLFRAIIPVDAFWDFESNRPSSGAFKDRRGLSVDRQGDRMHSEAVTALLKTMRSDSKIVSVSVAKCKEVPVTPIYKPSRKNIFHSEIHDSSDKIEISRSKAKHLQRLVELEN